MNDPSQLHNINQLEMANLIKETDRSSDQPNRMSNVI